MPDTKPGVVLITSCSSTRMTPPVVKVGVVLHLDNCFCPRNMLL